PVTFDPRSGLPQWLRATRDVPLWPVADGGQPTPDMLPSGSSYLKPLGPFGPTRIQVYFPGDSVHPAGQAWVETSAVEPSGIPVWISPPPAPATGLPLPPKKLVDGPAPDTTAIHIAIVDD